MSFLLLVLFGCRGTAPIERPHLDRTTGPNDVMRVHVIDVGQGAATLLEFPCGAMLIDAGGEDNQAFHSTLALIAYLDAFFERRRDLDHTLNSVIVTHPHADHTRSLLGVINRYRVENVVTDGLTEGSGGDDQKAIQEWAVGHRVPLDVVRVSELPTDGTGLSDDVIDPVGSCRGARVDPRIHVLWGDDGVVNGNENDDSVVVRADFGEASVMMMGDIEDDRIDDFLRLYAGHPEMLDVDILQVGHHGARNGTTRALVEATTPDIALISVGPYERTREMAGNEFVAREFGHPNAETIDALTDAVTMTRDPVTVHVGISGSAFGKPGSSVFESRTVDRAIYATAWDGTVTVMATAQGTLSVRVTGR